MKCLLYTGLILSLVVNVVLVADLRRPSAPDSTAAEAPIRAVSVATHAVPAKPAPVEIPAATSAEPGPKDPALEDPRAVIARMKAEGYPPRTITMAAIAAFTARNEGEYARTRALGNSHTWLPGSTEAKARYAELEKGMTALINEVNADLNPDLAAANEARRLWLTYGDIPPEKVRMLEAIERNYRPAIPATNLPTSGFVRIAAVESTDHPVLAEKARRARSWTEVQALVRSVLTPVEAEDYLRYNSTLLHSPASLVQSALVSLEVDEATYVQIADQANALGMEFSGDQLMQRIFPTIRQKIGDERFADTLDAYSTQIATLNDLLKGFGVSATSRADIFERVFADLQHPGPQNGPPTAARPVETRDFIISRAGLTAAQIAQLDQTGLGRQLVRRAAQP